MRASIGGTDHRSSSQLRFQQYQAEAFAEWTSPAPGSCRQHKRVSRSELMSELAIVEPEPQGTLFVLANQPEQLPGRRDTPADDHLNVSTTQGRSGIEQLWQPFISPVFQTECSNQGDSPMLRCLVGGCVRQRVKSLL